MRYLPFLLLLFGCSRSDNRVVLYCAQDKEFAESLVSEANTKGKIVVDVKYDTEANKSVSLYEEIVAEANRPRCDLFWNNEIINTIRLQRAGLLQEIPSQDRYPDWTRPENGAWQAFAARARILAVNTEKVKEADRPISILDLTDPKWKGKVAIAKPFFGTTATHAACLFDIMGPDAAKQFFTGLKANDIVVVAGNKQVAEGVAKGDFLIGLTDTDDAIIEIDQGRPLAMVWLDDVVNASDSKLGTLFIPNTLCIPKNARHLIGARLLANFLLAASSEDRLAEGGGYQIPLGKDSKAKLHPALRTPEQVRRMDVDFEKAADRWEETQKFLRDTFAR